MAEREGFEPSVDCSTAVFKTAKMLFNLWHFELNFVSFILLNVTKTGEKRGTVLKGGIG